jgi:hypothetical protein
LCSKSEDPDIAFALAGLAISSYQKTSGVKSAKIGHACLWALRNMPIREGIEQLSILETKIRDNNAPKIIEKALTVAAER